MANDVSIQPGHGTAGRHPTRQFLDSLSGHDDPGMFGRMFPTLPPLAVPEAALQALANAMKDANPDDPAGDNPNIPAGFTYLGQFVDHDITLDLTSIGEKAADPTAVQNFRTPALDLELDLWSGPRWKPASLCASTGWRQRQDAWSEVPDWQDDQCASRWRDRRSPQ